MADRQQQWQAPAQPAGTPVGPGTTPGGFSPVSWWYVTWRARVHEASTGKVEDRLSAIAEALAHSDVTGGRPGVRHVGPASVTFGFWFEAASAREAAGGARVALRQACRTAGVGDPTPKSSHHGVDVMLMFEELPTLQQDGP